MASSARSRRPRGSIDPERILDGAFALARETGLANLSMAELAARLDVGVTSIYWHVTNKDELLRRMAAKAIARLDEMLPRPDGRPPQEWRAYLAEYFALQRAILAQDSLLSDLTAVKDARYDQEGFDTAYRGLEAVIRYLVAAGFGALDAWHLYSSLSLYTEGFVGAERRRAATAFPPEGLRQLGLLDPDGTPLIASLVQHEGISIDLTGDAAFTAGLATILDGAGHRRSPAEAG
ncbi:TetR family transcriptional regulator [Actinocorallia herbida]|uniref:TetR family transcriptional regulator n=1 Tax=Actinocorallia herbida TaxID=58109 RepID=A0A3N1CWA7_9ACTN|nr:TetR family transcriptional regulator [Actinocorallia herbida]ROO85505.1 TetR family transcriptional regulator [Actinocorallia herbida]